MPRSVAFACLVLIHEVLSYFHSVNYLTSFSRLFDTTPVAIEGALEEEASIAEPLLVPEGPITRQRAKRIKEAMAGLVRKTMTECGMQAEDWKKIHEGSHGFGTQIFNVFRIAP